MASFPASCLFRFPAQLPTRRPRPRSAAISCCATFRPLDAIAAKEEKSWFEKAVNEGSNIVPLHRCVFSDHLTPVLAYRCLVHEDDREAPSFLFESVEQGPEGTNMGRYSVVGAQPAMEIVAKGNQVVVMDYEEECRTEKFVADPMGIPRSIMDRWKPQTVDSLPDAFCGNISVFP